MARRGDLLEDFRVIGRVFADGKENAARALICERLQHRRRIDRPRTVIERPPYFMVAQKIQLLEVLEAEARSAGGIDLNDAGDAERIGIGASSLGSGWPGRGPRGPPAV